MKQGAFHGDNKTDEVSGLMRERSGIRGAVNVAGGLLGADYQPRARNALSGRFICPPFTILNAREGWWQDRKRAWIGIGIRSELGRGENLLKFSDTVMAAQSGGLNKTVLLWHPESESALWLSRQEANSALESDPSLCEVAPTDPIYETAKKAASGKPLTWTGSKMDDKALDHYRKKKMGQAGNLGDAAAMLQRKRRKRTGVAAIGSHTRNKAGEATQKILQVGKYATAGKSAYMLPPSEDGENVLTGTSIFDPVLCEISYRWYCPEGGHVLDPFSGGSVRGIVAGELGLNYTGCDLSTKQVAANKQQGTDIGTKPAPTWLNGDSTEIFRLAGGELGEQYDFIFSCPPYGSLEVYSEDERDISNMGSDAFDEAYFKIIKEACRLLKPGRFACFVVGDYRDKDGYYCNLPAKTIVAFEDAGLRLYNEAILITAIGSLPMRINAQFLGSRKLGKTHQNVLVFAKGQPKDFVKTWKGNLLEKELG